MDTSEKAILSLLGNSDDTHDSNLMNLADEFDSPPEFAQEDDTMSVVESVPVEETGTEITVIEQ